MPYVVCPDRGLRVYTAAAYSGVDRDGLFLCYAVGAMEQPLRPRHRAPRSRDE
jgi:hypothetical protein